MSRKAWRWTKRIALGLVAFLVVSVGVVLVLLHTDWGRGIARSQVEARMNQAFIGGAKVGSLDGSVLGTMVLRDVVINGPDKKPAITIKKLSLGLGILPLFSKQARVKDVHAEDVEIDLRRDPDGMLQVSRMVRANKQKSGWALQIPELVVSRAHVRVQGTNGSEDTNLDDAHIAGEVYMPTDGPIRAGMLLLARWRERDVPVWLDTAFHNDEQALGVASLLARVGDVQVTAAGLRVIKPQQPMLVRPRATPTIVSGVLAVDGSKAAIAKLVPDVQIPVDGIDLSVMIAPRPLEPWTHVTVSGTIDHEPVLAEVDVDLDARRARGLVSTGRVSLTRLTSGKLEGVGTTLITFDGMLPRESNVLPVGGAMVHAGGDIMGLQDMLATVAVTSTGEQAAAAISMAAVGASAQLGGQVKKHGDHLVLESGRVLASVLDPSRATAGKAPVHGTLYVDVTARGVLSPEPDLAVNGRVVGSRLRAKGLTIRSLKLAVAASHLPSRPIGKAELEARDVERGNVFLRELDLDAANREDGKIAVTMRSRPKLDPWLVEADVLVTPGDTVVVDLERHRVRVANGTEWTGDTGQIVIGEQRLDIRDVATASKDGAIAIAGEMRRETGDLEAHVEVASFALDSVSKAYAGTLGARIDIERTNGRFAGVVDIDAHGVVVSPQAVPLDGYARIEAAADKLVIDATASNPKLGAIDFALDIDAPKDITSVAAWKTLHRRHIRSGRLQLVGIDAGRIAQLANVQGSYGGRIDGDIQMSPTTIGGLVQIKGLHGPALENLGPLSATLTVGQIAPNEIQPTLIAAIDDRGAAGTPVNKPLARVEMQATLAAPDHLFDPSAWQQLGRGAFKGGAMRVEDVMIEPPLLDRLQITTSLRGRASFTAEVTPKLERVKAQLALRRLRGNPIQTPVAVDLVGEIDNTVTTATLAVASTLPTQQRLLDVEARIPVSLDELVANPRALQTAKLEVTATLPEVPASRIAATFGHEQITGGILSGTIDVTGTVAKPIVKARLAGNNIAVPPGPRGKPVKTVKHLSVEADWDGTAGKLAIDATQDDGMLALTAHGNPKELDAASMSFTAKQFDVMPLLAFAPGPAGGAAGRLDGELKVTGLDPRRMKIAGELHLTNGRLPIHPIVGTLWRAKIDIVVADALTVNVDGRLGGGKLAANAKLRLDGAVPTGGDATITLREVSPIGVVEPDITADITAKLTRRPDAWVTDVTIAKGYVKVPEGRSEKLDPIGKPDDMMFVTQQKKEQAKAVGEEHRPTRPSLIANIVIQPTFVESNELRGYVRGKLTVQRDAGAIGLVGQLEAVRGDLDLFGRRYKLDRAAVRFDGSTDPLLDIVVTHDYPEVTTRTHVGGRLSKPELEMSSDPGTYSQGQLLGFLLGGEPQGQPAYGNPRDQAVTAGASIVANKIGGYVKNALPIDIDVLRYESATSTSGAAITVGTWISRSLFVAYRRRIEARPDENSGEGEVEYWFTRRVVVEGVVGDRGYNGVDLLWRRRF